MSLFPVPSEAFRAASRSRRSRLDPLPASHLMLVVRRVVFDVLGNWTPEQLVRVCACAARGCEEAGWLLSKLTSEGLVALAESQGWRFWGSDAQAWLCEITAREDSSLALYYTVQLSRDMDVTTAVKMLERAAGDGFAPAMAKLAWKVVGDDIETRMSWLRKAAALHDPNALYELASWGVPNRLALYLEAATGGNALCMKWLSNDSSLCLSQLQSSTWKARAYFLGEIYFMGDAAVHDAVERMAVARLLAPDVRLVHDVGRELEGIEQLWPKGPSLIWEMRFCVDFYRFVMHSARRAALQTIVAMRQLGLPRDVAILIARHVYNSRDDAVAWCGGECEKS